MNTAPPRVVLDASALLAWVLDEPGRKTIDRLLTIAVVPASAMVECLYRAKSKGQRQEPAELYADLLAVGIRVEAVTNADVVRAAELIASSQSNPTPTSSKTRSTPSSLSLGDGLCIAVAERLNLPLTGGDQHWETLELRVTYAPFR